jgi:hypothetical protein
MTIIWVKQNEGTPQRCLAEHVGYALAQGYLVCDPPAPEPTSEPVTGSPQPETAPVITPSPDTPPATDTRKKRGQNGRFQHS